MWTRSRACIAQTLLIVGSAACVGEATRPEPREPDHPRSISTSTWRETWAVPLAHAGPSGSGEVTTDRLGNAFVGNAVPWTGDVPVAGASVAGDVLLSSVDADGNTRWTVRTVGAAPSVTRLLPTGDGGVTVMFHCAGSAAAGGIRCAGDGGGTLATRFDASGRFLWTVPAEGVRDAVMGARDELYLLADAAEDEPGVVYLVAYDASGQLLGRSALRLDGCASLIALDGEVRVVGIVASGLDAVQVRVVCGLVGSLESWEFPFPPAWADRTDLHNVMCPVWLPDGDLYATHAIGGRGVLQRLGPHGEVRWSVDVYSLRGPGVDVSGNACLSWRHRRGGGNPASTRRYCGADEFDQITDVYSPDGVHLGSHVIPEYSRPPGDHCPTRGTPRATSAAESRGVSSWTVGDRTDGVTTLPTLVRYVRDTPSACDRGQHRCGGRCVDTANDLDHCGACDHPCHFASAVGRCIQGHCVSVGCGDGRAECNLAPEDGCEADLQRSRDHCGACGNVCDGACLGGVCCTADGCVAPFASDGHEGAFEPTADVVLSAGVHHFTTVTIPAGVTVRTDGDGVVELRAIGDVLIHGAIDLSGGEGQTPERYGPSVPGGGGGHTGRPGASPPGENGLADGGGAGADSFETSGAGATRRRPAQPGGGVAGGASGQGGSTSFSSCLSPARTFGSDPDDGREATRGGGRAWGAPYDGRGSPDDRRVCEDARTFPEFYEPVYSMTGLLAGGGSIGRVAAADLAVSHSFHPGSGGGGGGATGCASPGGGGGGGGGALRIVSEARIVMGPAGALRANGGRGGRNAGSGSGGVIYLAAPELRVSAGAEVEAVARGDESMPVAGLGRIRLSVDLSRCTIDGSFDPPLANGCRPTPGGGVAGRTFIAAWPR